MQAVYSFICFCLLVFSCQIFDFDISGIRDSIRQIYPKLKYSTSKTNKQNSEPANETNERINNPSTQIVSSTKLKNPQTEYMNFNYLCGMKLLVKTFFGLEPVLVEELERMGAREIIPLKRAVQFEGDLKMLYRASLELRTAVRILTPIHTFRAQNEDEFYDKVKAMDWGAHLDLKKTFAVDGVTNSPIFTHSKYIALKTKDAIVDQFRDKTGRRPNVDVRNPDLRINVHIKNDFITISFDTSGEPLFKRAYREDVGEAPINEVLAAGMILLSGWRGDKDFFDPMCGSGTIPIEAAMIAKNMAPNLLRKEFGFMKWPDFDAKLWNEVVEEAKTRIIDTELFIQRTDSSFQAFRIAERNAVAAGLRDVITLKRKQFERLEKRNTEGGVLIMNPPYDVRLGVNQINEFYKSIGDRFKQSWKGVDAWIISSNLEAMKNVGLRPSRRITLFNGSLECKFQKYEMYEGTKKVHKRFKNRDKSER